MSLDFRFIGYAPLLLLLLTTCSQQEISSTQYLDKSYKSEKITLIDLSDEVRFRPGTGELLSIDTARVFDLITHLITNQHSTIEIRVSHVYQASEYEEEGLTRSDNLKKYFIAEGLTPLRISNTTFLDRRSKYPHNSEYRKVVLVVTNLKAP